MHGYYVLQSANNESLCNYPDESKNKIAVEVWEADILIGRGSRELAEGAVFIKKYINYTELREIPVTPKKPSFITLRKDNR